MEDCDRPGMIRPYNRPEVHQAVHPAGGGIFTARDLARFYAMMGNGGELDGVRILKPETVAEATHLQSEANDFSLGMRMRRSLGLVLDDSRMGASTNAGDGLGTFGHGGAGTSVGWADPGLGLAVAYITNGFPRQRYQQPPSVGHLPGGTGRLPLIWADAHGVRYLPPGIPIRLGGRRRHGRIPGSLAGRGRFHSRQRR